MRLKAQWARGEEEEGDETDRKEPAAPRMQTATKDTVEWSEDGLDKKMPSTGCCGRQGCCEPVNIRSNEG
jgi:hypothetical protein